MYILELHTVLQVWSFSNIFKPGLFVVGVLFLFLLDNFDKWYDALKWFHIIQQKLKRQKLLLGMIFLLFAMDLFCCSISSKCQKVFISNFIKFANLETDIFFDFTFCHNKRQWCKRIEIKHHIPENRNRTLNIWSNLPFGKYFAHPSCHSWPRAQSKAHVLTGYTRSDLKYPMDNKHLKDRKSFSLGFC